MKVLRISLLILVLFSLTTAICYGQTAEEYNNIGNWYQNKGMYDEAMAECKKAIEIDPNCAVAYYKLGVAYEHNPEGIRYGRGCKLDEAMPDFKKALEIDPNYAAAHSNLALAYYEKGEYSLAIKHCDRAVELGCAVHPKFLELLKPYRKK